MTDKSPFFLTSFFVVKAGSAKKWHPSPFRGLHRKAICVLYLFGGCVRFCLLVVFWLFGVFFLREREDFLFVFWLCYFSWATACAWMYSLLDLLSLVE